MPFRRKNCGNWWISFDTPKGRATRSAKTENYDEAVVIEQEARSAFYRDRKIPEGYRRCSLCSKRAGDDIYKPEDQFPITKVTTGTKPTWCKECAAEWARRMYRTREVAERDERGRVVFDPNKLGMAIHQFVTGQPLTVKLPKSKSLSDSENQRRIRERIPRPSMVSDYRDNDDFDEF